MSRGQRDKEVHDARDKEWHNSSAHALEHKMTGNDCFRGCPMLFSLCTFGLCSHMVYII